MNPDVVTEWKVTWFPLSGPPWQCHTTTVDEAKAESVFKRELEAGTNPILENRVVKTTPWRVVQ